MLANHTSDNEARSQGGPLLQGTSIVCLASIDWAFNWQLPQEVASAFANNRNRVLFVENTGVRRATFRDAPRLRARFRNWRRAAGGVTSAGHGVDVFSPLLLPLPHSRLAGVINAHVLLRVVRQWLGDDHDRPLIVITFLPTLLARAVIRGLNPALVVYYCADRLAESSPGARNLRHSEPRLLAETDLVLVTAKGLLPAASQLTAPVELLPCGVRSREFERARAGDAEPPSAFGGLSGPVIGFVGSLRNEIDLALLTRAAELASDLNFVLIGPLQADVRRLAARPNVRLVEPMSHPEVVRHMVHFDVGILPYILNGFTASMLPMKLIEYLAAGLPVVSTPLPEVCRFAGEHAGVVAFATDAPSFVAALRAALASNGPAEVARRIAVAERYDWAEQMSRMSALMESALAARRRR
jgi:glycosyltransferase involved in cell wall biosynthesis